MNRHSERDDLPEPKNVSRGDISVFARKWFKLTRQQEARHYQELADKLNVTLKFDPGLKETTWRITPTSIEMHSNSTYGFAQDRLNIVMGFAFQQLNPEASFDIREFDFSDKAKKLKEEALWFAWGAMMPRDVFETQATLFKGSLLELSNYFHSTKEAVQSRAKSFGIDLTSLQHLKTNKPNI